MSEQSNLEVLAQHLDITARVFKTMLEDNVDDLIAGYTAAASGWTSFFRKDIGKVFNEMAAHKNLGNVFAENGYSRSVNACFPIDVDGSEFTREQLAGLSDKFKALHDLGLEYNVDIGFAGSDNMPRQVTGCNAGYSNDLRVLISLSTSRPYSVYSHPDFDGGNEEVLLARLNSFERRNI